MNRHRSRSLRSIASLCLALLSGCSSLRPVTVPIGSIREPAACAARPDTLLVLLPGAGSRPQDFRREGFVDAVRTRRIAADVVMVDAHTGYFDDRSIVDRLQADILAPARAQGYRQVWLVGISLGALGALLEAQMQPQGVAGIVAIGPYLGKRAVTAEIEAQGGLRRWRAPAGPLADEDFDTALWRWLQPYAVATAEGIEPADRPALYLGYGRDDRFAASHDLLAAALPHGRVFTAPGGHDWPPWLEVWQRMLEVMPLPRDASCAVAAVR